LQGWRLKAALASAKGTMWSFSPVMTSVGPPSGWAASALATVHGLRLAVAAVRVTVRFTLAGLPRTDLVVQTGRPSAPRERLLQSAAALFHAEGINGVGVDRVLAEAGVTRATMYRHFAGKEALVVAYLDQEDAAIRQLFTDAAAGGSREQLLAAVIEGSRWTPPGGTPAAARSSKPARSSPTPTAPCAPSYADTATGSARRSPN
jgi:hypothetical protein